VLECKLSPEEIDLGLVGGLEEGEGTIQDGMLKINLENMARVVQEEVRIKSHMEENQISEVIQVKK